jgi:hypothetical protein
MTILIVTAIASIIMALGLGYAFWIPLRALWFKADLLHILDQFLEEATAAGGIEDNAFKACWAVLWAIEEAGEHWSIALALSFYTGQKLAEQEEVNASPVKLITSNAALQAAIAKARGAISLRLARYIILETASGWGLALALLPIPQKEVRKAIQREVASSALALTAPWEWSGSAQ